MALPKMTRSRLHPTRARGIEIRMGPEVGGAGGRGRPGERAIGNRL